MIARKNKLTYRILESFRLEKIFTIIKSNHKPSTVKPTIK